MSVGASKQNEHDHRITLKLESFYAVFYHLSEIEILTNGVIMSQLMFNLVIYCHCRCN